MNYTRMICSKFWEDSKVEEFSPEDKYAFLYLLTNPLTSLCGCYEISIRRMSRDLGYNMESVSVIIDRLVAIKVIDYDRETSEVLIRNWSRYNWNASPKLDKPLIESIERVKSKTLKSWLIQRFDSDREIPYPYPIDTVSIGYQEKNETADTLCIPSISISNSISNKKMDVENSSDSKTPYCPQCNHSVVFKPVQGIFHCMTHGDLKREQVVFK